MAFAVRAIFVSTLEDRLYWPDEYHFNNIAISVMIGEGFESSAYHATPATPAFFAAVYQLFGYSYIAVRLVQSLLGALIAVFIYAVANRAFNRQVAFLSGLVLVFYPPLIYICGVLYSTCLFSFLVAFNIYLLSLIKGLKGRSLVLLLFAVAVCLGLTVLCRPIFLAFVPFAALYVAFTYEGGVGKRVLSAAVLMSIVLLTILPWTLRNYAEYGRFVLVATGMGRHLWSGNNELTRADSGDRYIMRGVNGLWHGDYHAVRMSEVAQERLKAFEPRQRAVLTQQYQDLIEHLQGLDEIEADKHLQHVALSYIAQYPGRSLGLLLQKLRTLYTPFSRLRDANQNMFSQKKRLALILIFYPIIILGLMGFVLSLNKWRDHLLLYLLLLSLSFAYSLLTVATRTRIPLDPYLIIFASYGASVIWEFVRSAASSSDWLSLHGLSRYVRKV